MKLRKCEASFNDILATTKQCGKQSSLQECNELLPWEKVALGENIGKTLTEVDHSLFEGCGIVYNMKTNNIFFGTLDEYEEAPWFGKPLPNVYKFMLGKLIKR